MGVIPFLRELQQAKPRTNAGRGASMRQPATEHGVNVGVRSPGTKTCTTRCTRRVEGSICIALLTHHPRFADGELKLVSVDALFFPPPSLFKGGEPVLCGGLFQQQSRAPCRTSRGSRVRSRLSRGPELSSEVKNVYVPHYIPAPAPHTKVTYKEREREKARPSRP